MTLHGRGLNGTATRNWPGNEPLQDSLQAPGLAPALELVNTLPQVGDSPRSEGDATKE